MSAGEVRGPLPPGWAVAKLPTVCEVLDSRRVPVSTEERSLRPGDIPYYGANGQAGTIDTHLFEGEHVLLAEDGGHFFDRSKSVAYVVDGRFWVNNHAHVLRPTLLLANLLAGQLNCVDWTGRATGSTRLKLTQGAMNEVELLVPPLAEQRRIVAKLDAVMAQVREARAALEAVPALLEQYRRAVLAAAFRGELTADWRAAHPEVEPASALLARIRTQLEWQQARRSAMRDEWNPEAEQGEWGADPLPTEWTWCRMTDICVDATDSERKLPQSEYKAAGIYPVIDQGERVPGGFCSDEALAYSGALPVVVFGDHSRRAHFVDRRFVQGADGTKVLVPSDACASKFLHITLLTIRLPDKGYSRHFKFLRASRFPLPPLAEQHEIVRRVEAALGRITRVKEAVEAQRQQLDALERAVLDKAFRGALVPQHPDDEPADAMLARLRAQRAAAGIAPKGRRGRPRGAGPEA